MNHVNRYAFTLIELLVVIAIISTLFALIVGVGGTSLFQRVDDVTTRHRLNQVLNGLEQYSTSDDLAQRLQRITGFDLELVPLRRVIHTITEDFGADIRSLSRHRDLPPGISTRWQSGINTSLGGVSSGWSGLPINSAAKITQAMTSRQTWPSQETSLDDTIMFMDRQVINDIRRGDRWRLGRFPYLVDWVNIDDTYAIASVWDDVSSHQTYVGSDDRRLDHFGLRRRRGNVSPRGETLDGTLEVLPDGIHGDDWYYSSWPNMVEEITDVGGEVAFLQIVWPESNWSASTPGDIPVVWHWPWGQRIFSRLEGAMIGQIEYRADSSAYIDRTLADLNPLHTIALLQAAGVLPPGEEGAEQYRNNRDPEQPWNDAWGGPIIVVCANFMVGRYDFDDENEIVGGIVRDSRDLLGGRDYFVTQANDTYGYHRSVYIAAASVGEDWQQLLPDPWDGNQDDVILRDLWLEVIQRMKPERWTGASFIRPPWSGIDRRDHNGSRYYLTAPKEYR